MNYREFKEIMDRHLFKDEKIKVLKKVLDDSTRFTSIFRATTPILKLYQFILQSREIRFGNGMEEVIEKILEDNGMQILEKVIYNSEGDELNLDQYFYNPKTNTYYFIEQKVRDDHDSTKKRGQIKNFQEKYEILREEHSEKVIGIMYFIDSEFEKNINFYTEKLKKLAGAKIKLLYNDELFSYLDFIDEYENLEKYLKKWVNNLTSKIDFEITDFNEIKNLENKYWKSLANSNKLWDKNIMAIFFPNNDILKEILNFLENKPRLRERNVICENLEDKINTYYDIKGKYKYN